MDIVGNQTKISFIHTKKKMSPLSKNVSWQFDDMLSNLRFSNTIVPQHPYFKNWIIQRKAYKEMILQNTHAHPLPHFVGEHVVLSKWRRCWEWLELFIIKVKRTHKCPPIINNNPMKGSIQKFSMAESIMGGVPLIRAFLSDHTPMKPAALREVWSHTMGPMGIMGPVSYKILKH